MPKVRSLSVRPLRSANLAFPVGGILASLSRRVGDAVAEVDRVQLEGRFGTAFPGAGGGFSDAVARASDVDALFAPVALASLGNRQAGANLDVAAARRQSTFRERYLNKDRLKAALEAVYGAGRRPKVISDLAALLDRRFSEIETLFGDEASKKPLRELVSETSVGAQTTKTETYTVGIKTPEYTVNVTSGETTTRHTTPVVISTPVKPNGDPLPEKFDSHVSTLEKYSSATTSPLVEPRHPRLEVEIGYKRDILDVQQAMVADAVAEGRHAEFDRIIEEEMRALDGELRRFQLAYAETYLTAPFGGTVTALFKEVGEPVQVGEPVLRIEDDAELLLVAWLQHRGPLRVGQKLMVESSELFESPHAVRIPVRIVSVRGHDADNDEWDLLLRATNDPGGWEVDPPLREPAEKWKLPLNYQFDRDTTSVSLVP